MKTKITKDDGFVWLIIEEADIATKLYEAGYPLYKLYDDDSEGYPNSIEAIQEHSNRGGVFGIEVGFIKDLVNPYEKIEQE